MVSRFKKAAADSISMPSSTSSSLYSPTSTSATSSSITVRGRLSGSGPRDLPGGRTGFGLSLAL